MSQTSLGLTAAQKHNFWVGDDENWTIADWSALSEDFEITQAEVEPWFHAVHNQGRLWEIARFRYGIFETISSSTSDLKYQEAHSLSEAADEVKLKLDDAQKELDQLIKFWKQKRANDRLSEKIDDSSDEELNAFASSDLNEEQVDEILKGLHLGEIKDPHLKIHLAERALDLKPYLRDKTTRTIARNILRKEISAYRQEHILNILGNKVAELDQSQKGTTDHNFKKILDTQAEIRTVEKHLGTIEKAIRDDLTELGADQMDQQEAKRVFTSSISEMMKRMQEFYADPANVPMDGIFTADEIVWLTTPTPFRDSQYRPDAVAAINHAMRPENLWDPNFKEKGVGREAARRLQKIVKEMGRDEVPIENGQEEPNPEIPIVPDSAPPAEQTPVQPAAPAASPRPREKSGCIV